MNRLIDWINIHGKLVVEADSKQNQSQDETIAVRIVLWSTVETTFKLHSADKRKV